MRVPLSVPLRCLVRVPLRVISARSVSISINANIFLLFIIIIVVMILEIFHLVTIDSWYWQ